MNKFKVLVSVARHSWVLATVSLFVSWLVLWNDVFIMLQYEIDDTFIYIGVLGGWLFVWVFYGASILILGYFMIRAIGIIEKCVNVSGEEQ